MVAVRERHAQRRDRGQARGDAVDDLDLDAGGAQVLHLLAAAAEDEGVAALEAHDGLAFARGHHHQLLDEGLRRALAAAALAHVHDARALGAAMATTVGADEVVDQHARWRPGWPSRP
jgi:hypothetical protein